MVDKLLRRLQELLAQQRGQVLARRGQQASGKQDLARQALAHDPQDLVADIRLEAIERQDHPALPDQGRPQPVVVGQRGRHELIVAVEQVGDAAKADGHAPADELGVDFGDAAVLGVAESADEGDDVEAELVLRQDQPPLLLGPSWHAEPLAAAIAAAADLEFETAGRLRDEIRSLEQDELGIPHPQQITAPKGKSTEGRPGTRKTRYGKTQRKFGR